MLIKPSGLRCSNTVYVALTGVSYLRAPSHTSTMEDLIADTETAIKVTTNRDTINLKRRIETIRSNNKRKNSGL